MLHVPLRVTFTTIALSLLIWLAFYRITPDAPLSLAETTIVSGVVLAAIMGVRWIVQRRRRRRAPSVSNSGGARSLLLMLAVAGVLQGCYGLSAPPPVARGPLQTGREYLIGAAREKPGYGLYSYLLLGSHPTTEATRIRYVRTLAAYLQAINPIEEMEEWLPPESLNVTYLPLATALPVSLARRCPGPDCRAETLAQVSSELVDRYNYPRARALLQTIPGEQWNGPYFVSYMKPLTGVHEVSELYLLQDLSTVPPDLIPTWVNVFIEQAGEKEYWEESTLRSLALGVRKAVATAAVGLPDVKEGLDVWIALAK